MENVASKAETTQTPGFDQAGRLPTGQRKEPEKEGMTCGPKEKSPRRMLCGTCSAGGCRQWKICTGDESIKVRVLILSALQDIHLCQFGTSGCARWWKNRSLRNSPLTRPSSSAHPVPRGLLCACASAGPPRRSCRSAWRSRHPVPCQAGRVVPLSTADRGSHAASGRRIPTSWPAGSSGPSPLRSTP